MMTKGHSDEALAALRSEARRLAADLPGPLRRIRMSTGDATLELEWATPQPDAAAAAGDLPTPLRRAAAETASEAAVGGHPPGSHVVTAPMVGTFYRAPSPGEAPFVEIGGTVEPDTAVGLVEAMKMMNEITADASGVVVEIVAADAQPVEYGQPLLVLAPQHG
jgi:acetyl-CoA carboxylase biotin carboxyl carrier protein